MEEYCMNEFFNDAYNKIIRIVLASETIEDPYEKNVTFTELNSLPVKAIVRDLTGAQSEWKMPGIETSKTKEIIVKKKYRNLLESSYKIAIDDDYYEGWKINGKMQIREEGDFLRIYVYIKRV